MANDNNTIQYDVDGYEVITNAIMDLLNLYPGLLENEIIKFNVLNENSGKAVFPVSGAIIEREIHDILGNTEQICQYPFMLVYRSGTLDEARRKRVKEFLDSIGRWCEKQPIKINDTTYQLDTYPELTDNREFTEIKRTSPAVCIGTYENGVEDWSISIIAKYRNIFSRR